MGAPAAVATKGGRVEAPGGKLPVLGGELRGIPAGYMGRTAQRAAAMATSFSCLGGKENIHCTSRTQSVSVLHTLQAL